jgi:AcrR family transcriptional regulator
VARRRATVSFLPIVAAVRAEPAGAGPVDEAVLDACAALLRRHGLRRWSVDDVADRAGVGRTTVYRRVGGRDELVHAVLARELRETVEAIEAAAAARDDLEDKLVDAALVAARALEGSVVDELLHTDPATFLPFLTTGAGPLLALARELLVAAAEHAGIRAGRDRLAAAAEVAARLGLSFILTRDTVLPLADDPAAARAVVRDLLEPVLASLTREVRSASR